MSSHRPLAVLRQAAEELLRLVMAEHLLMLRHWPRHSHPASPQLAMRFAGGRRYWRGPHPACAKAGSVVQSLRLAQCVAHCLRRRALSS